MNYAVTLLNSISDTITNNTGYSVFATLLAALVQFFFKSIAIDIYLIFFLIFLCATNTVSGVIKAKREGVYNDTVLRTSVTRKWTGYIVLLLALSLFMGVLFIAASKEGVLLVSEYWLNLPIVLMLVFFNAMELKSTLDNGALLGWKIPGFVHKLPDQVIEKVEDIGNNINLKKNDKENFK